MPLTLEQFGIDRLAPAERLELHGLIWDSVADSSGPMPDMHRRELDRRIADADADPAAGVPWEVVRERLLRSR